MAWHTGTECYRTFRDGQQGALLNCTSLPHSVTLASTMVRNSDEHQRSQREIDIGLRILILEK